MYRLSMMPGLAPMFLAVSSVSAKVPQVRIVLVELLANAATEWCFR